MLDVKIGQARPLLLLDADDHCWLRQHFFNYVHKHPLLHEHDELKRQQLADEFVHQVRKVPVFWIQDEYERGLRSEFRYWYVNVIYSDGVRIRQQRVAGADCLVIITDTPTSYAFISSPTEGEPLVYAVFFNPRGSW